MIHETANIDPELTSVFADELLSHSRVEDRAERLRDAGLLDPEGLDRLLDYTERLAPGNPGKAHRLADLCADVAEQANAPAAVPRANYIRVRTFNEKGELDRALEMVRAAHDGYVALGMNLEALRTNLGLMATLIDLGRYREALDAGRVVVNALGRQNESGFAVPTSRSDLLEATVHHNSGLCYEYTGEYDMALRSYASAKELFQGLGMIERVGEIDVNYGALLLQLGRHTEALCAQEAAASIFEETGLTSMRAKALANMGETQLHLGNYVESLRAFERARRLLDSVDALADEHLLLRDLGNAYLALNLHSEALAAYRDAEALFAKAGMVHDRARVLWGVGSVLISQSNFDAAEKTLAEAAELFTRAGNAPMRAGVMLEQASLMEARGDMDRALSTAFRALHLVSGHAWPVQRAYAHLRLADLLLPDTAEAQLHLLEAQRLIEHLHVPQLGYRIDARLGRVRLLEGREGEARTLLEKAVAAIEDSRNTVAQESLRCSFLRDKTDAYEDLLRLYLAHDDEESKKRAFAVAERARSRALVDLMAGSGETYPGVGDGASDGDIKALQAQLNLVYNQLIGGLDPEGAENPVPRLQARARRLEQEISRIRLRTAVATDRRDPFADSPGTEGFWEQLPPDVALLAYYAIGDEILAFVVTRERVETVRGVGSIEQVEGLLSRLAGQWDRFRAGGEFVGRNVEKLERSARRVLAALYGSLVEPVEGVLGELDQDLPEASGLPRKLVVVPHGLLHQVPFQALFDGRRYLLERFEVSYAPSAKVHLLCQKKAARPPRSALVLGVPDDNIPAVSLEVLTTASHFPDAELRANEEASLEALKSRATGRDVLHLACHGLFRSDNPMFSALKLHDGWLTANDAMRLDLGGAIVTLSACESGRYEVLGGDETLGLTRAFLGAGATTLVVSLWLVQDEATGELMDSWYKNLRDGMGRASALRAAQLKLKERRPHPYYWASFELVGKR